MTPQSDNSSNRTPLARSEHRPPAGAARQGKTPAEKVITVSLILRRRTALPLASLGGRHLSHEEFAEQYAADPSALEQVRTFAREHGLEVVENASSLARRTVKVRGPVSSMEQAFGVSLEDYEHAGRKFHCYSGVIALPGSVLDQVDAVLGLDSRPVAKPHFRIHKSAATRAATPAASASFTPAQVAKLYDFPTGVDGTGQTIAILELGGGYTDSDLQQYFQGLGLKTPTVVAVPVDGGSNAPTGDPSSADGEVMLDIEVASAVAPGARIAVYFADNSDQGFQDALTTAIHDTDNKPSVISISWGAPESAWSQQFLKSFDDACQSAAALGISITVASGDNGSSDGDSGNNVDFPASSPHVLACGGTSLTGSGSSIRQETVWNDQGSGGGATGGGVSAVFALPTWQANAGVPAPTASSGGRGVPDVAGDAAPATGYQVQVDGQQIVVGGTSAVAPLWAALIALINQQRGTPLGFFHAAIYQAGGKGFRDITEGSNGSFSATPGWDPCTGLGSPNGTELASVLASNTGN